MNLHCTALIYHSNPPRSGARERKVTLHLVRTTRTVKTSRVEELFLKIMDSRGNILYHIPAAGNLSRIHSRFLQNGMATVEFLQPPIQVQISQVKPQDLAKFLHLLKLGSKQSEGLRLLTDSVGRELGSGDVERPQTALIIDNRMELMNNKLFPDSLVSLQLVSSQLTTLDPNICSLRHLQVLSLRNNHLQRIPPNLGRLQSLRSLDCSLNPITTVSFDDILSLRRCSLTNLDLSNDALASITEAIVLLHTLQQLNIGGNRLISLPVSLASMTNLADLDFSNNAIRTIPAGLLRKEFQCLKINNNPWLNVPSQLLVDRSPPTLHELASEKLLHSRQLLDPRLLSMDHPGLNPILLVTIMAHSICSQCNRKPCFRPRIVTLKTNSPTFLAGTLHYDSGQQINVTSTMCWKCSRTA